MILCVCVRKKPCAPPDPVVRRLLDLPFFLLMYHSSSFHFTSLLLNTFVQK